MPDTTGRFRPKQSPSIQTIRLIENILITEDCWLWQGRINQDGYGAASENRRSVNAHRKVWKMLVGDPGNNTLMHRCPNKHCVNPDHLIIGRPGQRGAYPADAPPRIKMMGDNNRCAKLTEEQARFIHSHRGQGEPVYHRLAAQFNVNVVTIRNIINEQSWRHLWS